MFFRLLVACRFICSFARCLRSRFSSENAGQRDQKNPDFGGNGERAVQPITNDRGRQPCNTYSTARRLDSDNGEVRLADAFPSIDWPKPLRGLWVEWAKDGDCIRVRDLLRIRFNVVQMNGKDVEAFGNAAIGDLFRLKESARDHVDVFHELQFDVATGMMGLAARSKQMPLLWTWTVRSISDEAFDHFIYFDDVERLRQLMSCTRSVVRRMFADSFIEWLPLFYYFARRTGDFNEIARTLFNTALDRGFAAIPSESSADLLTFALAWDAEQRQPEGREAAYRLYDLYQEEVFPPSIGVRIGVLFATRVGLTHDFDIAAEAQKVIRSYEKYLKAHERLQVVCSSLAPGFKNLPAAKDDLIAAIRDYNRWLCEETPGERRLYDKGPIFETLLPVIATAFERGERRIAVELISAWKEVDAELSVEGDVLVILPTRRTGVGVSTPAGFEQSTPKNHWAEYRRLIEITNKALSLTINIPEDAEFQMIAPERIGVPRLEHGRDFLAALENFYFQPPLEQSYEATSAQSVAVIPWIPHPIGTLIQR